MDFTSAYSNLSNEDGRDKTEFSPTVLTFAGVITFIIMIIGIFGNFLTVAALYKCPKVRNVAAAFIISLCMADLLFCAIVLPFSALRFLKGTWTHGKFLCKLIPFIQYGNIGVSLLCIAMITINRYVMIAHHASYAKIYRKHWIAVMIIFCWAFSYGMQLPTLLGVWGTFDYDEKLETCSIMNDQHGRSSKTTLFITAFIIPALVIIACYTKIFWVVRQSELRLKTHANQQNSIPNNLRPVQTPTGTVMESEQNRVSSNLASDSSFSTDVKQDAIQKPSRIKDQREMRAKRNEWRITKMVLAIFLSFVICYLPITIAKVADKDVEYPNFHIFSYIMLYLSACINPIIYVIMNKQYRKAYKTVIMCEPSKLLPFRKSTAAGSSAAVRFREMERYRIEQQPQSNNGVTNVSGRTTKLQLGPCAPTATVQFHGINEQSVHTECLGKHSRGEHSYTKKANNSSRTATHATSIPIGQPFVAFYTTSPEQGSPPHSHGRGRHHSGGRRRSSDAISTGIIHPPRSKDDVNYEQGRCFEESPILWPKHKYHSR
ncbi:G-protein coupled receptor moody isoform X2 [Bactrocera oleae]|uniref:G-protein coupled receptor moody isoform X2 n=1 Tax=Bactrocera oleae TaxID=104688 RepID=UPI00387EA61A